MPELPEVETVVRHLARHVLGAVISGAWCDSPKLISGKTPAAFARAIRGARIESITRRGKNILIGLSGGKMMLIHQKMTGHLLLGAWHLGRGGARARAAKGPLTEPVNQFIHLVLRFADGRMVGLSDMRKFAKVLLGAREDILALPELRKLGPEPFDSGLTPRAFAARAAKSRRKIKTVLLDQHIVAGIGNIYADEILWMVRVSPLRRADRVTAREYAAILRATRTVLRRSIKLRGASLSDFRAPDGTSGGYGPVRIAYQRHGTPCPRCRTMLVRRMVGGRSAHFCPTCQPLHPTKAKPKSKP